MSPPARCSHDNPVIAESLHRQALCPLVVPLYSLPLSKVLPRRYCLYPQRFQMHRMGRCPGEPMLSTVLLGTAMFEEGSQARLVAEFEIAIQATPTVSFRQNFV
jgi:hypothetical protein